jgi:hypothetical protein
MTVHATRALIARHEPVEGPARPVLWLPDTPEWDLVGRAVTVIRDPDTAPLAPLATLPSWRARPWLAIGWDGQPSFYLRTTPHRPQDTDLAKLIAGRSRP